MSTCKFCGGKCPQRLPSSAAYGAFNGILIQLYIRTYVFVLNQSHKNKHYYFLCHRLVSNVPNYHRLSLQTVDTLLNMKKLILYPVKTTLLQLSVMQLVFTYQRRVDMLMCILCTFKNISREPIDYSTEWALMGLNGVD